jgi:predicted CXXCH cytochrome family protein
MKKTRWPAFLLIVIAVLTSMIVSACGMERIAKPGRPDYKGLERIAKPNRQGSTGHGACVTCHRTNDPSADSPSQAFAGGIEPSSACLDCHHYEVNHHPVNIAPKEGSAGASQNVFPLFEGQIRCLTCHQAHNDPGHNNLNSAPKLLRGGPYPDQRTICFQCHGQDDYTKIDPHKMISTDGKVREVNGRPVCLLCHTAQPDPAGDPELVEFRADVAFLCWRCHTPMAGSFLRGHFHVKPKKPTRVVLLSSEIKLGIELPLARDGMLTCSTCHNPHQAGVITRAAVQAGADAPKRLRIAASSICAACHAK